MTLNLVTPLWRGVENLKRLAESIPDYSDIRWIVVKADSYVLDIDVSVYPNLHLISLNIEDSKDNVHIKVNAAIDYMQPGHFQGLDDDTIFCPNTYNRTHSCINGNYNGNGINNMMNIDFSIPQAQFPIIIQPNEKKAIYICFRPRKAQIKEYIDSLFFKLNCSDFIMIY
jgi:hypothetical protein